MHAYTMKSELKSTEAKAKGSAVLWHTCMNLESKLCACKCYIRKQTKRTKLQALEKTKGKMKRDTRKKDQSEHTYVCHITSLQTVSSTCKFGPFLQHYRNPATEPTCWDSNADLTSGRWRKNFVFPICWMEHAFNVES